ncbi:hypothetical protein [Chromobacterium sp. IIBBL 290-4]|uniref:hypothetical protein n=1 Tax=Chromobacterium sp. IIBBL 290-4 TaxID=2953890 RepID=UPI0020B67F34|nr:hypothetical protein [Chromobacterium sp. IIBBL 290-4]UTH75056.1 hypothetical protein NKT35_02840 [Chromobacterium sp. IIBBL 290-4]
MKKQLIYALSAGGVMLGASAVAHAEQLQMAAEPTLSSHGSALLVKKLDAAKDYERLAQLRTLAHGSAIHCNIPNCLVCGGYQRFAPSSSL